MKDGGWTHVCFFSFPPSWFGRGSGRTLGVSGPVHSFVGLIFWLGGDVIQPGCPTPSPLPPSDREEGGVPRGGGSIPVSSGRETDPPSTLPSPRGWTPPVGRCSDPPSPPSPDEEPPTPMPRSSSARVRAARGGNPRGREGGVAHHNESGRSAIWCVATRVRVETRSRFERPRRRHGGNQRDVGNALRRSGA